MSTFQGGNLQQTPIESKTIWYFLLTVCGTFRAAQEQLCWRENLQWCFVAHQVVLNVNMNPLESTSEFSYLGRIVTYNISSWAALYTNLRKVHKFWAMAAKVIRQTGEHMKECDMRYKTLFQKVLLYQCEIWVVMDEMMTVLEGFRLMLAQILAGLTVRRGDDGEW